MRVDEELQDRFRRLARAVPQEATGTVERELRARFRARHRRTKRLWAYAAEAAALVVAVAGLRWAVTHGGDAPSEPAATATGASSGFVALPYSQSGVPLESPVIVTVKIPLSELSVMGMPVGTARGSGKVNADMLVGQDGVVRAVRLVQ